MDKCHIIDEKGDHIQDPADAEDAVMSEYEIYLEIKGNYIITVRAESEEEAIYLAKKEWSRENIEYEYTSEGVE